MTTIKYNIKFKGLNFKKRSYDLAFNRLKKNLADKREDYTSMVSEELREKANTFRDTGRLESSIIRTERSRSSTYKNEVTLKPHVPYWVFNEFGLKEPRWVVVDTKPALIDWLSRHPHVGTREVFWKKLGIKVNMLWIGRKGTTHLGTKNVFVQPIRDKIDKEHKISFLFVVQDNRNTIKKIGAM